LIHAKKGTDVQNEAQVVDNCDELSKQKEEQLPSVMKSHLPPHLLPRMKKPLALTTNIRMNAVSTPAQAKRRQVERWFNSPTDAFLSPCTQKLMKHKADNVIQPLNLDQTDDNDNDNDNGNHGNGQQLMDCD